METDAVTTDVRGPAARVRSAFLTRLRDATQLRLFVTATVLLTAYLAIYQPLRSRIDESTSAVARAQRRLALASEVARLRSEFGQFKDRIPAKTDSNEWVQYVLGGIRTLPLKLITLDATGTKEIGPYKAVIMIVELEGEFQDLDAMLRWFEANDRLFRVDELRIVPNRLGNGRLVMHITLLGVMA